MLPSGFILSDDPAFSRRAPPSSSPSSAAAASSPLPHSQLWRQRRAGTLPSAAAARAITVVVAVGLSFGLNPLKIPALRRYSSHSEASERSRQTPERMRPRRFRPAAGHVFSEGRWRDPDALLRFIIFKLQARKPSAVYPVSTKGQPGVNLGSTWSRPAVNLGWPSQHRSSAPNSAPTSASTSAPGAYTRSLLRST